jgi:hypothetical protein
MPEGWPSEPLADVAERLDALRHAASVPGADSAGLLEAALTEFDGLIEALAGALARGTMDRPTRSGRNGGCCTLPSSRPPSHSSCSSRMARSAGRTTRPPR